MEFTNLTNIAWICLAIVNVTALITFILKQHSGHKETYKELKGNTQISRDAFSAANRFNMKLEMVMERLDKIEKDFIPAPTIFERLGGIEAKMEQVEGKMEKIIDRCRECDSFQPPQAGENDEQDKRSAKP